MADNQLVPPKNRRASWAVDVDLATVQMDSNAVLLTKVTDFDPAAMDGIAERLWQKMFHFPVLVICAYCESINAVTNGTCLHCNGPLGNAKKYRP